jgi:hypothetical protein
VLLQSAWIDGDERAHASRDADSRGEDVVNHERRGGEKSRIGAEILRRDGIGATPAWVGVDGLTIREEDDDEQDDDGERDGHDVVHAEDAERDEESERRFWSVRCR